MKKYPIVLLLLALQGISAEANLLVNGNFEEGDAGPYSTITIPGWTAWGTGGWIYNNAGEIIGTRSAKIWAANTGLYQDVGITPGQTYSVIAKLTSFTRSAMIDRSAVVTVEWYDSSNITEPIQIDTIGFFHTGVDPFDIWKSIGKQITAPHTANILRVVATVRDTGDAPTKTANFDEFEVIETPLPSDNTPPTPDPIAFAIEPQTEGADTIVMVATTAQDSSGVEYYFTCTEGSGHDSGWQNSTLYRDTDLTPGTEYTYTVKAKDLSFEQNETAPSLPASTVTNAVTEISFVNGNFEQGDGGNFGSVTIPGWATEGTGGSHHSNANETIDTKSISISDTSTVIRQQTNIVPGHYYRISASIASFSSDPLINSEGCLRAVWLDNGADIGSNTIGYFIPTVDDNDSWKSISAVIASPANASAVRIIAQLCNADEVLSAGSVNFDNILISATGPEECVKSDFNGDCRVNINDVGILAENWQEIYTLVDLAEMADIWLGCIMHEQLDCH